ncbi:uncharacterized protein AMSG_01518 [Thecamonas trahens ATCC 50062]|uniref:Tetraspanin family protein n=1 Tax=Thecamonas trahens ATCC 50062 TaxID=461836 RepID=A0A0L0DQV6_THETB|nr:hypothetical protein AMSG_01518 [Thecamonas trahens ATCC 50062]KNC54667.1 hypothetical protein AMSG_01518 [Thecamonas trahens ATCC 50062]|eukprot:XP_013761569.1 hypothetical protein AMSG_01518 [Thecamonas trahens ATCC 50062]
MPIPGALIVFGLVVFLGALCLTYLLVWHETAWHVHVVAAGLAFVAYAAVAAVACAALWHSRHLAQVMQNGWEEASPDVRDKIQAKFACCGWNSYAHLPGPSCNVNDATRPACSSGVLAHTSLRLRMFEATALVVGLMLAAIILLLVAYVVETRAALDLRHELSIELSGQYSSSQAPAAKPTESRSRSTKGTTTSTAVDAAL